MNLWTLTLLCVLQGTWASEHVRKERGASVYPVFGTGGHGSTQNNYLTQSDTSGFLHYLGGQQGGSSSHGSYGFVPIQDPSSHRNSNNGHRNSIFDQNLLNVYTISSNHLSPASTTAAPATSHGYGGSFYSTHYGLLTPNFAHSPSPSSSYTPSHSHALPTLSASSLAHSAQSSFYAQNNLLNALLAGSRPQQYKGSINY